MFISSVNYFEILHSKQDKEKQWRELYEEMEKENRQEKPRRKKKRRRNEKMTSGELKKGEVKRILLRNQEMTGSGRKMMPKETSWVKMKKSGLTRRMNCNWVKNLTLRGK